ncbi:L,D-transpeptidase family protein [Gordonia sp. DT30]|uniref:L,D-transpeptidase n=1 Tax=unclassified Gordonia (in: high G+C Gram-positive bacteria) TaxID=2657482 RepID=UPI003CE6ED2C
MTRFDRSRRGSSAALVRHGWLVLLILTATVITVFSVIRLGYGADNSSPARAEDRQPVSTPEPNATDVPAKPDPCAGNTEPRRVTVSISAQDLWFCERDKVIRYSPVTTGTAEHPTPTGSWRILYHETDRDLSGPGYVVFVRYWLPFSGDFGFHDSPWQKFPYGDRDRYKTSGSQGCVHVPEPTMAALYDWAGDGTAVTVMA